MFLVQCKQWRAAKVSVQVVRELYGVMSARGAAGGFVVTSGGFTKDAWKFARATNVSLVDGERLVEWFKPASEKGHALPGGNSEPAADQAISEPAVVLNGEAVDERQAQSTKNKQLLSCPRCGGGMTPRYAKAMNNGIASNVFLGCLNFPACRGTRQIEG